MLQRIRRDHYAGAVMLLFGLGVAFYGSQYDMGSMSRVGPGVFPVGLGAILALLGVAIAWCAEPAASATAIVPATTIPTVGGDSHHTDLKPDARGWVCIISSIVLFIVLANYFGLAISAFVCVFVAAMGDRQGSIKGSLILAAVMTIFAVVLFDFGLHIQIPIVQGF